MKKHRKFFMFSLLLIVLFLISFENRDTFYINIHQESKISLSFFKKMVELKLLKFQVDCCSQDEPSIFANQISTQIKESKQKQLKIDDEFPHLIN